MKIAPILTALLLLAGCAGARPCWYKGKAVSRGQAEDMKAVGMDVQCP